MKIEFFESEYGMEVSMKPENIKEVSQLARFTKNAKAEKPSVTLYFGDEPTCSIWMRKIQKKSQSNSITNSRS